MSNENAFGKWSFVAEAGTRKYKHGTHRLWLCRCECGTERVVLANNVLRGFTQSCGCAKVETEDALLQRIFSHYRTAARNRKIDFRLTRAECFSLFAQDCFYCGNPPGNQSRHHSPTGKKMIFYTGIDRLDSSKGYTSDNVVPCCGPCNIIKREMNFPAFLSHCRQVVAHLSGVDASQFSQVRGV